MEQLFVECALGLDISLSAIIALTNAKQILVTSVCIIDGNTYTIIDSL